MKYKGFTLFENGASELSCVVMYKQHYNDDFLLDKRETLIRMFNDFNNVNEFWIDIQTDYLIMVRCTDITFNKQGLDLLKKVFVKLVNENEEKLQAEILIEVSIDDLFRDEDGEIYTCEYLSTWEELEQNIIYE